MDAKAAALLHSIARNHALIDGNKRLALVDDRPGVTRDRREGQARLGDLTFTIVDTAGLEEAGAESLAGRMLAQTRTAIAQADAVFFLLDAKNLLN